MARSFSRNWLRLALATGVVLQALLATCPPAAAQNKTAAKALTITQTVTGLDTLSTQLKSTISNVGFGSSGANGQKGERHHGGTIVSVPSQTYGNGVQTQAAILSSAMVSLSNARADLVAAAMKSFMASNDVQAATFIFQQQVRPQGSNRDFKLQWQVTVTDGGRVLYSAPKVTDSDPTIVYVSYTSSAVNSGLPASWAYTGGGRLSWQLRRPDGTATTDWVYVETGGAYNEPTDGSDPDLPIICLASAASSNVCPTGFTDALTLMGQTNSTSAVIDYVRQVQPVYIESVVAGVTEYTPSLGVSYDSRVLSLSDCNGGYRNTGRIGYTLKTLVDRYSLTTSRPTPSLINQFTGTALSPTQTFDISKDYTGTEASLSSMVLNPFDGNATLVDVSSIPGVQFLAIIQSSSGSTNANNLTLQQSDTTASWVPTGNGNYSLYFGPLVDNYGTGSLVYYDHSLTFNLSDKSLLKSFILAETRLKNTVYVYLNGTLRFLYWPDYCRIITCSSNEVQAYTSWGKSPNLDLLPYLVTGQNTIRLRTLGVGESAIRIDATSCLAK